MTDDNLKLDRSMSELHLFIVRQVRAMWDIEVQEENILSLALEATLNRIFNNYSRLKNNTPRYKIQDRPAFSPLHSDQYCVFLHYLREETTAVDAGSPISDKLFSLNKMLHSVDFYSAKLPDHFMVSHPVGSVVGRALFSPKIQGRGHCLIYQQVTIGGSYGPGGTLYYPTIGDNVILYAGSSVVGNSEIGDYCIVSLGAKIKDEIIPDNSIVFGSSPNLTIKELTLERYYELSPYLP